MDAERKLCSDCQSFYGTKATEFRCSSCYKAYLTLHPKEEQKSDKKEGEQNNEQNEKIQEEEAPVKKVQENKERCWNCNRRHGLNGIECKCGYVYCSKHRLPESHECQFDHKQYARNENQKKLEQAQTKISKIEKMESEEQK